ncbi:UNVERIFIED_CONTAM: hypothetical protein Sradi_4410400 [Sesamum radiatum]|uniref:Uncharacterized protein n=1 Tax=Sesamum radiatum TaxID=300843 RepID=A0AAW2NTF5_SESRA
MDGLGVGGAKEQVKTLAFLIGEKTGFAWHFPLGSPMEAELAGVERNSWQKNA